MCRVVSEPEFRKELDELLDTFEGVEFGSVMGPGRSGAVAAVYASHKLGIPFVPYGGNPPKHRGPLLIIDTAQQSGRTLRKAERKYADADPVAKAVFNEPPRVKFWYESHEQ